MNQKNIPSHFKGKNALAHVVEAQKEGIIASTEVHGQEASGQVVAFIDSLRDTVIFLLLIYLPLLFVYTALNPIIVLGFSAIGWTLWKTGRSALLGWSRLERLHRIVEQEKWEIEHHRQQEREELTELYQAKGFTGKLLEDVIDVLMADGDRLLRVMIEEELGLTLEKQEHPLKQALGSFLGAMTASLLMILSLFIPTFFAPLGCAAALLLGAGYLLARETDNMKIPAMVWHLGLGGLSVGFTYLLFKELL
jgi:hypothetical protein